MRMGSEKQYSINEQEDGASGFHPTNYQNDFYDISNGSWNELEFYRLNLSKKKISLFKHVTIEYLC